MSIFDTKNNCMYMLDIETDGLSVIENSITSLCLMRFDSTTFKEMDYLHFKFTHKLPKRYVNALTLEWRIKHGVHTAEAVIPLALSIPEGLKAVFDFVIEDTAVLFCNHTHFDAAFLQVYLDHFPYVNPFRYNRIYDIDSVMIGRELDPAQVRADVDASETWKKAVSDMKISGETAHLHDARYDCRYQIALLRHAMYNAY